MSCGGCVQGKAVSGPYTKGADGRLYQDDVMTADAMCAACRYAGPVICSVSGKPARGHSARQDCPKGRHPKSGVVRWLGVWWYGVPYPIRRYLKAIGKVKDYRKLPGCGCIKAIKDALVLVGLK